MNHLTTRLLAAVFGLAAVAEPAGAQTGLSAVVLRGAATRPGIAPPGTPTVLTPGVRIESPQNSWTEIAFSDGSSVVLEPGADFTLQGIERGSASGCHVIRASAGRGRLRITTSDCTEVALATPTAQVRVVAASAVVVAGSGGSATMISGNRVVVQRNGQEEVLRRPGFAVVFNDGDIVREFAHAARPIPRQLRPGRGRRGTERQRRNPGCPRYQSGAARRQCVLDRSHAQRGNKSSAHPESTNTNANSNPDSDPNANPDPDPNANPDPDPNSNADPDPNSNPDLGTNSNPDPSNPPAEGVLNHSLNWPIMSLL